MQAGTPDNIMAELGFTPDAYNWAATIQGVSENPICASLDHSLTPKTLQISYIIFELPSNLLLKWMTPHALEARIFLTWGIATACCGAVKTTGQLLACRFIVGLVLVYIFQPVSMLQ